MNAILLLSYVFTVLLLIATPGPVVALVAGTAATQGTRQAVLAAAGSNVASWVLLGVCAWILISGTALDSTWLAGLNLLGCLFIGYLALVSLRSSRSPRQAQPTPQPARSRASGGSWRQGFMVGISNPKDIIFFMSLFPQFLGITSSFGTSLLLLSLLWISIDLAILGLYIFAIGKMASPRTGRWISQLSGLALLAIACLGALYNIDELLGSRPRA